MSDTKFVYGNCARSKQNEIIIISKTMATSLQKSSSCHTAMTNSRCIPLTLKRQNSEIRIIFKTLGPSPSNSSVVPSQLTAAMKCPNDSGLFDSSLETKPLLLQTPKNPTDVNQPDQQCNKCKLRYEKRFFSLCKTQCKCTKKMRKFSADENASELELMRNGTVNETYRNDAKMRTKHFPLRIPFSDYLIQNSPVFRKKRLENTTNYSVASALNNMNLAANVESSKTGDISKKHYIFKDEMFEKRLPACSTPKFIKTANENQKSGAFNLQTPPADARFIDSDCESMDELRDNFQDDGKTNSLVKCFSLTRSSCRSLTTTIANLARSPASAPSSPSPMRNYLAWASLNMKKKPLDASPLKRQKNIKLPKNVDKKSYLLSKRLGSQSHSQESLLNISSDNLGCHPLLTKENIDQQEQQNWDPDQTLSWGDNFEFSFICEPSTSDNEDDIESRSNAEFSIPAVQITPPQPITQPSKLAQNNDDEFLVQNRNRHRLQDQTIIALSPFRRSISDPSFLINDAVATNQWLSENKFIKIERDEDEHVTVHQATVVSLQTLTVSLLLLFLFCVFLFLYFLSQF